MIDAANLMLIAYGAHCQHAQLSLRPDVAARNVDSCWLRASVPPPVVQRRSAVSVGTSAVREECRQAA